MVIVIWLIVKKHPHVRGEDNIIDDKANRFEETPPRAWGRLSLEKLNESDVGNTPTCVGKTW